MSSIVSVAGNSFSVPAEGDSGWASDVTSLLIQLATSTKVLQVTSSSFPLTQDVSFGTSYGLKLQYIKSQAINPASAGVVRLGNAETIKWRNAANNADLDLTVNSSNALQFNGSTILSSGVGLIVNADVSNSAAIAYSKLNLSSSILNADVNSSAAIAYSKLNLSSSIVNSDVSNSAAIAYSKLSLSNSIMNADVNSSAAIAYSKLNLSNSILNADINSSASIALSKLAALTVGKALQSNASTGAIEASSVTNTELGYVSGVTSAIQTQLNAKISNSLTTSTGDMIYASSASTPARLAVGSSGQVLKSVGGLPTWATFSGGINYLSSNPDAEADTTGWATYADAAGAVPVDGTGGSPNSTWTRTTSSPLRGSASFLFTHNSGASRQGEGASYAFTIDTSDKAKILQISFDYLIASGTFVAGNPADRTSVGDSDLTVYIYDVTNAVLIQPSTYRLFSNSTTIADKFIANFQTASNSTSYRLIIHCGSTSASAFTAQFDNFNVGPSQYVYGTPITDWTSYTPTYNGFGTPTSVSMWWRRVGGNIELQGKFTTGTVAASEARVSFPSGITSDNTTRIPTIQSVGHWFEANPTVVPGAILIEPSVTYVTFGSGSSGNNSFGKLNGSTVAANTEVVGLFCSVPVAGWSSSVQMSDSTDTRVVAARYSTAAGQSIATSSIVVVDFGTKTSDTHSSVTTGASWKFTAPVSGKYSVKASIRMSSSTTTGGTFLYLYKNGSAVSSNVYTNQQSTNGIMAMPVLVDTIDLIAGDYIDFRISHANAGSLSIYNDATYNYVDIEKISGPSAIAATETIAAIYEMNANQSIPNTTETTITWDTKVRDTHAAMNASGIFTVPAAGIYTINATVGYTSNSTGLRYIVLSQTGSATKDYRAMENNSPGTGAFVMSATVGFNCRAGDTLFVRTYQSSGGALTLNGPNQNVVTIQKTGN
mgnify:CR=1 FL=1